MDLLRFSLLARFAAVTICQTLILLRQVGQELRPVILFQLRENIAPHKQEVIVFYFAQHP